MIGFCEYPKSILFIGNSYLYYNDSMHNHVEELMEDFYEGEEIVTKSATIGGSRLENHNIDHLLKPKNLQRKEQVDMVIMQGGSGEVIDEVSRKKFIKTAVKYSKKARKKGVKPALFMTHAYTENDDRYEPNLIEKIKINNQWLNGPIIGNLFGGWDAEALIYGVDDLGASQSVSRKKTFNHLKSLNLSAMLDKRSSLA